MSIALDQRTVAELTTQELHDAWEWRLVQDGIRAIDEGRYREVTPAFFDEMRARIREKAASST